jgi:predicted TIM-barrel fold metal-dependent hydrolase
MATRIGDVAMEDLAHTIVTGERAGYNTTKHLEKATRQAIDRKYQDFLIVDCDAHHYETESWPDIVKYIEDPILRHRGGGTGRHGAATTLMYGAPGNQSVAGRVVRYPRRKYEQTEPDQNRDLQLVRREMDAIGIDYQVVFPTPMLELGMHPDPHIEAQLSFAYTRYLTEEILVHDPRIKTMVYLPFNDPDASLRAIEYFSDKPGVVGFMVTSARYKPVHHNDYMPIYRALEERNMPLGFHAIFHSTERIFEGMNRFISVHALGFILYNFVHLTNMVINGIPERFPKLKILWIENGLAWIPFLMQRLDNEYMMRTSEAPLLKKKPSEYMRENFYYSTQPMEDGNLEALALTMKMINAETQLMFASDYPHWDFNLPSTIYDLPFLSEQAKRNILGENAREFFNLPPGKMTNLGAASASATNGTNGQR